MLEIKNIEVYGINRSIIASGNPMSMGEIDTEYKEEKASSKLFEDALSRSKKLGKAPGASGHDNYLKGIIVQFDIKYPQYWTPEAQRYHWLDIVSSQSKMHRLSSMGIRKDFETMFNKYVNPNTINDIREKIIEYNSCSVPSIEEDEIKYLKNKYELFMYIISNLPMGFEMWETISTNYLQLKSIYNQRKNHKLKEDWGVFCKMIQSLPLFTELTGIE